VIVIVVTEIALGRRTKKEMS